MNENDINVMPEEQPEACGAPEPADVPGEYAPPAESAVAQQPVIEAAKSENMIAGIVGALLFALIGSVLYLVIYQFGFIAGICGLITFVLSNFGYGLFSGNRNSTKGVIFAIIMTVLAIAAAEYLGLSFEIYKVFKDDADISFFDAIRATPVFLKDTEIGPELVGGMVKDLLIAYALGAFAAFGTVKSAIKSGKAAKAQTVAQQPEIK